MRVIDDVRLVLAPPHRAGWPFIGIGLAVVMAGLFVSGWLFWFGVALTLFCVYFFRDPERVPPARPGAVLAPADGRVVLVGLATPPEELGLGPASRWRVAIFLSVLDVHINRVPFDGVVSRVAYRPGAFVSASLDKASDSNERNAIAIRLANGDHMAVVQIAGLIARRIICSVREGDAVTAGSRFGLIRFGSRTDLYLPEGVRPLVSPGQYMIGGETVIAETDV
ncbi:MAG: phosphatidylserine decarboxylase [Acetobacteraceae bacterium]|nr:phosphatidylserine decarboxylase [Acetobacteraceae bacterium]